MSFKDGLIGLAEPGPVLTTKALGKDGSTRHLGIIREKSYRFCGHRHTSKIQQKSQKEIHGTVRSREYFRSE